MDLRYLRHTPELRDSDEGKTISGYAAVFYREGDEGSQFWLWDDKVERIDREAFSRAIADEHDVRALFNHDSAHLLGRVKSGTLALSVDKTGLRYDIAVPDTRTGADVVEMIRRGDLDGSSFAFIPTRAEWISEDGYEVRLIKDVDLIDVGPVTYPAYSSTTTSVRAQDLDAIRAEYARWRGSDADLVRESQYRLVRSRNVRAGV